MEAMGPAPPLWEAVMEAMGLVPPLGEAMSHKFTLLLHQMNGLGTGNMLLILLRVTLWCICVTIAYSIYTYIPY